MRSFLTFTILTVALAVGVREVLGQGEAMTNRQITEMTQAGFSTELILKKMSAAGAKFDVSSGALIELKKAGVAEEVIAAMLDRSEAGSSGSGVASEIGYSDSDAKPVNITSSAPPQQSKKEMIASAKTIAVVKSSLQPSRQALEKELMKQPDFRSANLTIIRYKESADIYIEIGRVPFSWLTHRYVYRIYDRRSGVVLGAGETTSWGSLAENLARNIGKSLKAAGD